MRNSTLNENNDDLIVESLCDNVILGILFRMEILPDPDLTEEKIIMILYSKVEKLIH